jgi:hypothetical protein
MRAPGFASQSSTLDFVRSPVDDERAGPAGHEQSHNGEAKRVEFAQLGSSRCIVRKYEILSFCRRVTREACLQQRLTSRSAIVELRKSPAAGGGILRRVLDHELKVRRGTGHKGLNAAENFIVFFGGNVFPGQPGNDRAIRKRARSFPICPDRNVIPEDGPQIVKVARFMRDGNQLPVAVPRRNLDAEDRDVFGTPAAKRR